MLLSGAAQATLQETFKQGNDLYLAGKYNEAVTAYESASQQGLRHWILSYNLGDAYYRSGRLGKSVLHFERSFHLNSGNGDVIHNLSLASTKAGDPRLPISALPALGWAFFHWPNLNVLTILSALLFWALAAGLILRFLGRRTFPVVTLQVVTVALFIVGGWVAARVYLLQRDMGVVVASVAEVRSGPNLSYPANFTVPEGRRVLILDEVEPVSGWLEIGVPQEGLKGWVPDTAVEKI
jgi:hypothetical protein